MDYIYGAALLFAALACLSTARIVFRNRAAANSGESFGSAEAISLAITTIGAAGVAVLAQALMANWSLLGAAEGVAAFMAVIVAAVAAHRVIDRAIGRGNKAGGLGGFSLESANQNREGGPERIRAA